MLKLSEWKSPPPIKFLKPEDIGRLKIDWPAYKDDAHTDNLTGLPNRRAFDEMLSIAVKEATLQGTSFALLMFDLDNFKLVNDTYGHVAGDHVLKEFARRVSGALRSTDICSRYGGEEFCILTVVSPRQVFDIGERVRLAVKNLPFSVPGHKPIAVTCSFGYSIFPFDAASCEELLKKADDALYKAKKEGRDRGLPISGKEAGA